MSARMATLLSAMLATGPALAQMSPPAGSLQLPHKGIHSPAPPRPPTVPSAAPRAPVQRVAPMASPAVPVPPRSALGAPAVGAKPPVVTAKAGAQPAKPATSKAVPSKPGAAAGAAAGVAAGAGAAAALPRPPEPSKGTVTGQPLPRWAGIQYDGVKLRVGPGQRYPVEWIYRRPDQPVRILREFETWRLIEDHDGVKGWVHQSNLTGRRTFMVPGADRVLRGSAAEDAAPVAILKPGVVGRIRGCAAGSAWCEVRVGDYRGWLKRDGLWGLSAGEAVGN